MIDLWRATREWEGEIGFIVAGGPSVLTQDIELLRGRKVIAINCSHEIVPWADFLIFADSRFFHHYRQKILGFKGRIVSASTTVSGPPKIHRMHRKATQGLATDNGSVAIKLTTLTAAINLAVHLGARAIILLGADGKKAADGRTHHHADHPWRQLNGCWDKQKADLRAVANDLTKLGIRCINASPGSAWADIWPVMSLPQAIESLKETTSADEHLAGIPAAAANPAATAAA